MYTDSLGIEPLKICGLSTRLLSCVHVIIVCVLSFFLSRQTAVLSCYLTLPVGPSIVFPVFQSLLKDITLPVGTQEATKSRLFSNVKSLFVLLSSIYLCRPQTLFLFWGLFIFVLFFFLFCFLFTSPHFPVPITKYVRRGEDGGGSFVADLYSENRSVEKKRSEVREKSRVKKD